MAYVDQQAQHHAAGTTIPVLERTYGDPSPIAHDPHQNFYIDNQAWLQEMLTMDAVVFD